MTKQGEINYLKNIGESGTIHAQNKPFSDDNCGKYFMEIGIVMSLLPSPPKKILDLGCGTGWTSIFLARRGYNVTGLDISADMIDCAKRNQNIENIRNVEFVVSDYETNDFNQNYDCAIFFDSLHHAMDEQSAIQMAYNALRPGGICITLEPGSGHENAPGSIEAMKKFNVTEKDMPPTKIIKMGKLAGFTQFEIYPHADDIRALIYSRERYHEDINRNITDFLNIYKNHNGIVFMIKPTHEKYSNDYDSIIISENIPKKMFVGESHTISIVMKNIGNNDWSNSDFIRLGIVDDISGDTYKFGVGRVDITNNVTVYPDQTYSFTFTITCPENPGIYKLKYQMLCEHVQWFGSILSKEISVEPKE